MHLLIFASIFILSITFVLLKIWLSAFLTKVYTDHDRPVLVVCAFSDNDFLCAMTSRFYNPCITKQVSGQNVIKVTSGHSLLGAWANL